jgi:DNA-directed RNA polymerase subunit K/omega
MAKEIPFPEDFEAVTNNIYEAVMVVAHRARKIATDQKLEIEKNMTVVEPEEEKEEEPPAKEAKVEYNFEKPTIIAFRELIDKDLEFEYREK